MNANVTALNSKIFACLAASAACAMLSGITQAKDHVVTIKIPVSYAGLDLSRPTDARELYRRVRVAAYIACTSGNRVDLEPVIAPTACFEQAIGDAVRSANLPQLTMVYLSQHTPKDASAHGIEVPVLVAAK